MEANRIYRWQSDRRYYLACVEKDLFDQWCVSRAWGGLHSRLGNALTEPVESLQDGLARLDEIHRRRLQRGYTLTV